ncbi:uncharacterized protein [Halyomorpha halys]|uniref:uncharacterized protein n=1 Tax=Halyomorpha halys TaxID=286706 RepID=UPI0006D4F3DF|nr:uncharacterized protein LOC106680227 [Halyomorpha halys]XP_024215921.1 uncharacterized protein LOC106680227 [Halyomorpha halys]XP_024215922.1 uncharacterized protein LOC106680227 [Halyomorpha halys]
MVNETSLQPSISCSWNSDIPDSILTFGEKDDPSQWGPDGDIVHTMVEDNFFHLKNIEEGDSCTICIRTNDPLVHITNISIVSEAQLFEIYGKHGEYIKTCRSDYFTEAKGIDIYVAQSSLLTSHQINIKFPGLKREFWLFGIKLLVQKISTQSSTFDYNLIDEKLQSSNVAITEKAEKFKKFLQEYAANKYTTKGMDPQMLLKFMEGECVAHLKPGSNTSKSISDYLSSLIPSTLKIQDSNGSKNKKIHIDVDSSPEDSNFSTFKNYVDESLQKMEDKLQQNFQKQLQELEEKQNKKLDTILELLRNSALR